MSETSYAHFAATRGSEPIPSGLERVQSRLARPADLQRPRGGDAIQRRVGRYMG